MYWVFGVKAKHETTQDSNEAFQGNAGLG